MCDPRRDRGEPWQTVVSRGNPRLTVVPLISRANSVILTDASLILASYSALTEARDPGAQRLLSPRTRRKAGFVCSPPNSVIVTDSPMTPLREHDLSPIIGARFSDRGRRQRAAPYEVLSLTPRTFSLTPMPRLGYGGGGLWFGDPPPRFISYCYSVRLKKRATVTSTAGEVWQTVRH